MQVPVQESPLGSIQQAYLTLPGDPLIQGWCPNSKLVGAPDYRRQGAGQSWGTCESRFVNTRDTNLNCVFEQNLSGVAFGTNTHIGGQATLQMVSPSSFSKLGAPDTLVRMPQSFGGGGLLNAGAGTQSLATNWDSGSGVQGPPQQYSYGTYSQCPSCNSAGYSSYGVGTCASLAPANSDCGSANGTRYWSQIDSQLPNRMANDLGYGGK
jgi:hypothetical protein